ADGAPLHGAVAQVLQRRARFGARRGRIAARGAAAQVLEMHAAEPLQIVEHGLLVARGAVQRGLGERDDRHQPASVSSAAAARLPFAIFDVTTAERSMSERNIRIREMSRLAVGISTLSNKFTRWVTRRTAP